MNYDHILAFHGTSIEKHEYLRFDSRPKDETVIARIQECCAALARRAELTRRGWAEDSLKLDMMITADGTCYSSETMTELYAGIEALDTANAFSIEADTEGREGCFLIMSIEDKDGGVHDEVSLPAAETLQQLAEKMRDTENFEYTHISFYPDSGSFSVAKIVDGEYVDFSKAASADILKDCGNDWWSYELFLGVSYQDGLHAETDAKLKDAVRRHLPEDEVVYIQNRWAEAEEEGESYTSLLNGSQWNGDLNGLEAFLCEVNAIVAQDPGAEFEVESDSILTDRERLGWARIAVENNEAHVIGVHL